MSNRKLTAVVGTMVPLAILSGSLFGSPPVGLAIVALALVIGWARVPRFWRTVLRALVAGGLAGVLVLGPGLRLAMRIVALLEPTRTPEFSLEGTAFIIVGLGAFVGAITTAWVSLIAAGLGLPRWASSTLLGVATAAQLFGDSEILGEFTELGAGVWVNGPMFLGVVLAFALLGDRWARVSGTSLASTPTDTAAIRVPS